MNRAEEYKRGRAEQTPARGGEGRKRPGRVEAYRTDEDGTGEKAEVGDVDRFREPRVRSTQ